MHQSKPMIFQLQQQKVSRYEILVNNGILFIGIGTNDPQPFFISDQSILIYLILYEI
jgi:hypothetical protein